MKEDPRKARLQQAIDSMRDRKTAYCQVFGSENGANKLIMGDLRRFCRADESTFRPDAREHALLEGRREVMLRILDFVELPLDQLVKKYGGIDVKNVLG